MATYGVEEASMGSQEDSFRGLGWLTFAGVMLGLAGLWNLCAGIIGLANSKFYGVNNTYVFSDLRTWAWIVLFLGIIEMIASFALFGGSQVARFFGIGAASVNAIGQLAFVPVYPFWALMVFSLDVLVIYGLAVYGGQKVTYS